MFTQNPVHKWLCSFMNNHPGLERTQMSYSRWTNIQMMVIPSSKLLINATTCMNLKGSVLSKRSQNVMHCMSQFKSYSRKAKLQIWRTGQWLPGFEGGEKVFYKEVAWGCFLGWWKCSVLVVVMVTLYMWSKLMGTVHQNTWVYFL